MLQSLRTARGIMRSLGIYYGHRRHAAAMDRLYREFVRPGELVFDIGAHVGDRIGAFRRLGARVVAVEPQPALVRTLKLIYGRDRNVVILRSAVGRAAGHTTMMINIDNPTLSTASRSFIVAARGASGWEGQAWDGSIEVTVTTLDALITAHGQPTFIKIDVEGFEAAALAGLTQPVNALSFEFTTIQRDVARDCVDRCATLGFVRFNAALGESQELGSWRSATEITRWLDELPHSANSGDIYALRGDKP
jgi:FkbM family methyltransferase